METKTKNAKVVNYDVTNLKSVANFLKANNGFIVSDCKEIEPNRYLIAGLFYNQATKNGFVGLSTDQTRTIRFSSNVPYEVGQFMPTDNNQPVNIKVVAKLALTKDGHICVITKWISDNSPCPTDAMPVKTSFGVVYNIKPDVQLVTMMVDTINNLAVGSPDKAKLAKEMEDELKRSLVVLGYSLNQIIE